MAYLIRATPPVYSSLHGDLIYTVSYSEHTGDPITYPNFKFIADVYVNTVQVATIRKVPNPQTNIGIFNIGQVVRNYLATTFNPSGSVVVAQQLGNPGFFLSVQIKFGEEYSYASTYDLVVDSARIFFNNYNGRLVGVSSNLVALTNKVASSRPLTGNQTMLTSLYNFVPYFPIVGTAVAFVVTPSGGGAVYSTTFTPSAANVMQILNVAPAALNAAAPGTINASTQRYTVQIGSQTYTFEIICEAKYAVRMVHFLNKYGGFESKLFTKVSRTSYDIKRTDFGKLNYTVDASGVVSYYDTSTNVYNESRSNYAVQIKEKVLMNSDLLTDQEYTWLADLVFSPMVYVEESGYFFPVIITDNSYEPKKVINDELTNLVINVEFGQQLNSQYR